MKIIFEPLGKRHDRSAFSCGQSDLDDWFRKRAGQDELRHVARVFVAADSELGVVGFYSLSAFSLEAGDLPHELARKLPLYTNGYPAALIGRLARGERVRGKGFGELLVVDAILRVLDAAETLAIHAIVVDAKDERAATFYQRMGFERFPNHPQRLFMLATTAARALENI